MELALYCPDCGYYEREGDTIGRGGDYYTSVSVGSLFGELLGFQFAEWLGANARSEMGGSRSAGGGVDGVEVVEAGTHRGELALDILRWLRQRRPALFQRLEYRIVEPSERRRQWQQQTLAEFAAKVRWAKDLSALVTAPSAPGPTEAGPAGRDLPGIQRIIFANELLDALPVHRLGWDAKSQAWFEWGVIVQEGRFAWTRLSDHAFCLTQRESFPMLTPQLSALLPDGFTVEVCPGAAEWWGSAASVLGRGKLLTLDYGFTAEESLAPERKDGTLRGYHGHRLRSDVLAFPGAQDITAHVNFTALEAVGESAGLRTEAFITQAQFLTRIATRIWGGEGSFGEWTAQRTRQFQTLTHPEHLGRAFRVLVQGRG